MSNQQNASTAVKAAGITIQDVYYTEAEAANLLNLSCRTLQRWRQDGLGLRFRRFGGLVRYARSDIKNWADKQSYLSTSEADHGAS